MKRFMMTAAFVASLVTWGYSQERPVRQGVRPVRTIQSRQMGSPEERAKRSTEAMEKRLNLNAEQKAKVYALNLERAQRVEKLMKAQQEFRKNQMVKQKAYQEESNKKLNNILSDEQKKSYEEMRKQRNERMKARRPGPPGNRMR